MGDLHIPDSWDISSAVPKDKYTDIETLEYLIKVFSGKNTRIVVDQDATEDQINDGAITISGDGLPQNIPGLINLSTRMQNPSFIGRLIHLSSHLKYTFSAPTENDHLVKEIAFFLEDLRIEAEYLKYRSLDTRNVAIYTEELAKSYLHLGNLSSLDISIVYLLLVGRQHTCRNQAQAETYSRSFLPHFSDDQMQRFNELTELALSSSSWEELSNIAEQWIENSKSKTLSLHRNCVISVQDNIEEESSVEDEDSADSEANESTDEKSEEQLSTSPISLEESIGEIIAESIEQETEEDDEDYFEEESIALELTLQDKFKQKSEEIQTKEKLDRSVKEVFPKTVLACNSRMPNFDDRNLASSLVQSFRKAQWRAPTKVVRSSKTPPGRLSSRAAVTSAAQRSRGLPVTAEPFRQTVRRRSEAPPLILGIACDISGSMESSEIPMAQMMWACAHAVPRVGGKFAAVSFGNKVNALVPPGTIPKQVPILKAKDGYESAFKAVSALAGGLNMLDPKIGVRVLIISSDGMWQNKELTPTIDLLKKLEKQGVFIIWVPFQGLFFTRFLKTKESFSPMLQVGSILDFDSTKHIPRELGKLISERVQKA